ncbi:MAG: glycoprotease [Ruthenibacterium sp.]
MITLGIDTSNYATSLAVFDTQTKEVVCDCKRFLPVKPGELGLRQSDAVFHHTAALPELLREINEKIPLTEMDAIGVSAKPRPVDGSYMPCFLTGVCVADAIGLAKNIPVVACTHQQGHIAAALFATHNESLFSAQTLVFHISGGTTELLLCQNADVLENVGHTTDLYAGQAVDRIGVKLGFAFPAGAALSKLAAECTEKIEPKVSVKETNCSLSGLENQCNQLLQNGAEPAYVAKYCLSAIGQTVLAMVAGAKKKYPHAQVICAGGVMSSDIIRTLVQNRMPDIYFVPGKFASDNAIGVSILAAKKVESWQM